MPLWLAYTPAPHDQTFLYQGQVYTQPIGGGTYGVSLTPVIFRWNFLTQFAAHSALVSGRGRADLHHAQVSAGCAGPARHAGWHLCVEFLSAGRSRHSLLSCAPALDRSGRQRGAYLVGLAGRPQSRSERQHPDPGGLYVLEMSTKDAVVECVPNFSEGRDAQLRRGDCGRDARGGGAPARLVDGRRPQPLRRDHCRANRPRSLKRPCAARARPPN